MMYGAAAAPTGWLLCDGTSYLQATYPALFAVIGTTFGSADGTHFNVPQMQNYFPMGAGGAGPSLGTVTADATHVHGAGTYVVTPTGTITNGAITQGGITQPTFTFSGVGVTTGGFSIGVDGAGIGTGSGYAKTQLVGSGTTIRARQITVTGYTDTIKVTTAATASDSTGSITVGADLGGVTGSGLYSPTGTIVAGTAVGVANPSQASSSFAGASDSVTGSSAATQAPVPRNVALTYIIKT